MQCCSDHIFSRYHRFDEKNKGVLITSVIEIFQFIDIKRKLQLVEEQTYSLRPNYNEGELYIYGYFY